MESIIIDHFRLGEGDYMEKGRIDEALREAIRSDSRSLNALSKECHVHPSALSRFVREKRDLRLSSAARVVDALGLDLTLVRFLPDPVAVDAELVSVGSSANEEIKSIGGKSRNVPYLEAIETAVRDRSATYERLITGTSITHYLHSHLDRLLGTPGVKIRATDREYFNHLTVTEYECLMFLPGVEEDHFYGLRFKGHIHSRRFGSYFSNVFERSDKVRDPTQLTDLCLRCGG